MKDITRGILTIIVVGAVVGGGMYFFRSTPCEETLSYKIGTFDDRFNISREKFLAALKEAEEVWESALGFNLFEYDERASFAVHLLFDERQARTIAERQERSALVKLSAVYEDLSSEHKELYMRYEQEADAYSAARRDYVLRLEEFNAEVARWNSRGGAPRNVYDELEAERRELENEAKRLEEKRIALNAMVQRLNEVGDKSNVIASKYNRGITTYRNRYGGSHEFNQGEYDNGSIKIFQFDDPVELPLVLAHELGHALGIGHVENPQSVMYYLMGDQPLEEVALSPQDIEALKRLCKL